MAWGGDDNNVVRFRRGLDAYSFPPIRLLGEMTRDPAVMVSLLSEVLKRLENSGDQAAYQHAGLHVGAS